MFSHRKIRNPFTYRILFNFTHEKNYLNSFTVCFGLSKLLKTRLYLIKRYECNIFVHNQPNTPQSNNISKLSYETKTITYLPF